MIKATLLGPVAVDGWEINFTSPPLVGDQLRIDGRNYVVIRRSWREQTDRMSLLLTLDTA